MLSNFDPATNSMVKATDGSIADRALINPDRNNFGPRLGFAYTVTDATVIRGGYGISYVHFNRAGGGNLLPINGPQVVNAVVNQTNPAQPAFVPAEQGYPAGLTDPSQFNPLTANITYMPRTSIRARCRAGTSRCSASSAGTCCSTSPTSATARTICCCSPTTTRPRPTTPPGRSRCRIAGPIPAFADITYAFNGGKSRYKALQTKFEWRMSRGVSLLSSLTLSETKDNGSQSLENANGNFPAPQDFNNLDADFGLSEYHQPYNSTTSFVWTLPFGSGRRWASTASPWSTRCIGGWQLRRHQHASTPASR